MKIIFLDIDGVLSPVKLEGQDKSENLFPYSCEFSGEAVENLKKILKESGAYLVLSTRWVGVMGFKATVLALASHGINGPYFTEHLVKPTKDNEIYSGDWIDEDKTSKFRGESITPKKMSSYKCNEISWWLERYSKYIEGYVVLDDDYIDWQDKYQVETNPEIGLTKDNVIQALDILNQGMDTYRENNHEK